MIFSALQQTNMIWMLRRLILTLNKERNHPTSTKKIQIKQIKQIKQLMKRKVSAVHMYISLK